MSINMATAQRRVIASPSQIRLAAALLKSNVPKTIGTLIASPMTPNDHWKPTLPPICMNKPVTINIGSNRAVGIAGKPWEARRAISSQAAIEAGTALMHDTQEGSHSRATSRRQMFAAV